MASSTEQRDAKKRNDGVEAAFGVAGTGFEALEIVDLFVGSSSRLCVSVVLKKTKSSLQQHQQQQRQQQQKQLQVSLVTCKFYIPKILLII